MSKVPVKRYQLMKRRYPELMQAVEHLGEVASAGPLDEKTKQLIQLAAAAALGPGAGCTPRVAVEAPKEPIVINMNIKIEHEIQVKVDRELETLFQSEQEIF